MSTITTILFAAFLATTIGCAVDPGDGTGVLLQLEPASSGKEDGALGDITYRWRDVAATGYRATGVSDVRVLRPGALDVTANMLVLSPPAGSAFDVRVEDPNHPSEFLLFARPVNTERWQNLHFAGRDDEAQPVRLFTSAGIDEHGALEIRRAHTEPFRYEASSYPWRDGTAWQFGVLVIPQGATAEIQRLPWEVVYTCGFDEAC